MTIARYSLGNSVDVYKRQFLFNLTVEFVDPLLDRRFRLLLIERTADADDD